MCEGSRLQRCTEQRVAAWTSLCSGATATSEWRFKAEEKLKLPTTIMMASSANFGENPDAAALGKASERLRALADCYRERGGGSVTVGSTLADDQYTQVSTNLGQRPGVHKEERKNYHNN